MTATTVDLRYRTHDVLRSLDRGESVVITFRGKRCGIISPMTSTASTTTPVRKVTGHPYFGSASKEAETVDAVMDRLRGGRFR